MIKNQQTWNAQRYATNARFVADMGMTVFDWLNPQPGERILDLGCGDGEHALKLTELGCDVLGVDASASFITACQQRGVNAQQMDGQQLTFANEFDAVFSNAALHWMPDVDGVINSVWRALKPGGRFVAECGGGDNIRFILAAITDALTKRGMCAAELNPWTFSSAEFFRERLEVQGFIVERCEIFNRPTHLPQGLKAWLETMAGDFTAAVPENERDELLNDIVETARPNLYQKGEWTADYVRLRIHAHKSGTRV